MKLYYVQCASGSTAHTMEVVPDTALERRCMERDAEGYPDALILGMNECPSCIDGDRSRRPVWDERPPISDSPYEGQLRPISA
jgi:hypothetical protein